MTELEALSAEELIESFDLFDTWEERYQYIIELGRELEPLPDEFKTEENRVQGCQSNVWMIVHVREGTPRLISFQADSDSSIVKGLIAILVKLYSGKTTEQIVQLEIEEVFKKLELRQHLSRSRSNGLHSMIQRIRKLAVENA